MTSLAIIDKHSLTLKYVQLCLFIVIIILIQYKLFIMTFSLLLAMVMYMSITSIGNRVFIWVTAAYSLGFLIYLYSDRLIEELPLTISFQMILNRCLLVIPIIFMVYVIRKFNVNWNKYLVKPDWRTSISFPFIWNGFHTVSVKVFLLIAIEINIASMLPFIKYTYLSSTDFLTFLIMFSIINATLEEILWRGILLTRLTDLAGEKAAVIFSGLAFGFSHIAMGYSLGACLAFAVGGIFYAGITVRSGSIFPAIIWHFVVNVLMILSGIIQYIG